MADVSYGVTSTGWKRKRLDDIKTEITSKLRADIGSFLSLLPSTVLGNLIGIFAEREDSLWALAEDVYNSQFRGSASGIQLQNVLALVGVDYLAAAKSTQRGLLLYGTAGAIVPANTQVRVPGNPAATFATVSGVVLVAGQDQVQRLRLADTPDGGSFKLRYINEDTAALPYNATSQQIADALNATSKLEGVTVVRTGVQIDVTFAGLSGKTPHPKLLAVENSLVKGVTPVPLAWFQNAQEAIPQGQVDAQALVEGPTAALLYSLTEIVNPVTGLDRVLNLTDAEVGRYIEDDNSARVRSTTAQAAPGRSSPDAIKARLQDVSGVTKAIVFQNEGDSTDGNGLPPHSIRAYVAGGADQDIRNMLWASKPGGIYTDGLVTGTVTDSSGLPQPVRFSRPEVKAIYISVQITKDSTFPANGADTVRAALAGYVNALDIGDDVIVYPRMISVLNSISGITDVVLKVGTSANPTADDNIVTDVQQVARVIAPATDVVVTVS